MKIQLTQQIQTRTSNVRKRNTVLAAASVLFLCLASVVAIRFRTYDSSASSDSDTLFDYCIFAYTECLTDPAGMRYWPHRGSGLYIAEPDDTAKRTWSAAYLSLTHATWRRIWGYGRTKWGWGATRSMWI